MPQSSVFSFWHLNVQSTEHFCNDLLLDKHHFQFLLFVEQNCLFVCFVNPAPAYNFVVLAGVWSTDLSLSLSLGIPDIVYYEWRWVGAAFSLYSTLFMTNMGN